jgi:hypothetical protein
MYNSGLICCIKTNDKILREHNNIVRLPFGSDYSIYLKNLNTVKAEVKITIDGQDILDGNSLIIDAGRNIDIGRWLLNGDLNRGPKLRFIEKTDTIRETKVETGMDGLVEITYQFEKVWPTQVYGNFLDNTLYRSTGPKTLLGGAFGSMKVGSSIDGSTRGSTTCDVPMQTLYSANVNHVQPEEETLCSSNIFENEDGMTVKGQEVKQEFRYASIGTLDCTVHKIVLQLKGDTNKGKVQQPLLVKSKVKCSVCNKSQISNNKFCVSCGNNMKY